MSAESHTHQEIRLLVEINGHSAIKPFFVAIWEQLSYNFRSYGVLKVAALVILENVDGFISLKCSNGQKFDSFNNTIGELERIGMT
jgi:hypothetical protein